MKHVEKSVAGNDFHKMFRHLTDLKRDMMVDFHHQKGTDDSLGDVTYNGCDNDTHQANFKEKQQENNEQRPQQSPGYPCNRKQIVSFMG